MIHVIGGALQQYVHSGAVTLFKRNRDHNVGLDNQGNAVLNVRSPQSDLTIDPKNKYSCYDQVSNQFVPTSIYRNSHELLSMEKDEIRKINPRIMLQMLNELIVDDLTMGITIHPNTLISALNAMIYNDPNTGMPIVAGIKDYAAPQNKGGKGHDFVDPGLQYAFYGYKMSFIHKQIGNALRNDENKCEAVPMFSSRFRYLPDNLQDFIDKVS